MLIPFAQAYAAAVAVGSQIRDIFRLIDLQAWDEARNDFRTVARVYMSFDDTPPASLEFEGISYRMGQVSGPAMSWVAYDAY